MAGVSGYRCIALSKGEAEAVRDAIAERLCRLHDIETIIGDEVFTTVKQQLKYVLLLIEESSTGD